MTLSPQYAVTRFGLEAFLVLEKKIFVFLPYMGMAAILFYDAEPFVHPEQKAQCEIWWKWVMLFQRRRHLKITRLRLRDYDGLESLSEQTSS